MIHALLLSALLSQTLYEWVDSKGESHFTDDVGSIPKGAKRKTIEGTPLMVVAPSGDAGVPRAAVVPAKPAPVVGSPEAKPTDACTRARGQVDALEKRLVQMKTDAQAAQTDEGLACQQVLRIQGQPAFARCMASRQDVKVPATAPVETELESARETLRRAQVDGCR